MKRLQSVILVAVVACARGAQVRAQSVPSLCAPGGRGETPSPRMWNDTLNRSARPAELVGRIISVTGAPVGHAAIALQRSLRGDSTAVRTWVDSTGTFRFAAVSPAMYILRVQAIGFGQLWQTVALRPAASDSVCIRLRPAPADLVPGVPAGDSPVPTPSNDR